MKTTIKTLYQNGYNKTQIGRMLGIDRKTIRKVLRKAAPGKERKNKEDSEKGVWPSMLDEYREYLEIELSKELSITRIHQDLQKEFGIQCGFTTLRDYVKNTWIHSSCLHGASYPSQRRCTGGLWLHRSTEGKWDTPQGMGLCHVLKLFPVHVCGSHNGQDCTNVNPLPYRKLPLLWWGPTDRKDRQLNRRHCGSRFL